MEKDMFYTYEEESDNSTSSSVEAPARDTIDEVWGNDYGFYPDSSF